jgi:ribosome-binding protein aMBF1 (putative translation factor)
MRPFQWEIKMLDGERYYASFPDEEPQERQSLSCRELRRNLGCWLKHIREARGLSQRDLAEKVGADLYTFISQLESGLGRIPPEHYRIWAKALGVAPAEFLTKLMRANP